MTVPVSESSLLMNNAMEPYSFHRETLVQERNPMDYPRYTHNMKEFPDKDGPKSQDLLSSTPQVAVSHSIVSSNCVPKRISGTCKKGPKGANLFVYHLPCEVDNEDLVTLFSFFGPLVSVKVRVTSWNEL